jgi:hypothetical protein
MFGPVKDAALAKGFWVDRRGFLQMGALTIGGAALPTLLHAEDTLGIKNSSKAVINIHLPGGPSHQDMFDLKPLAPKEFRGEFNPISTNVSGLEICELLPRLAANADKWAVVRSMIGSYEDHSNFHTLTGWGREDLKNVGGRPSIGAVASKMLGPTGTGAPASVSFGGDYPGFLGPAYGGYYPQGGDLRLVGGVTSDRLDGRTSLLTGLDQLRRDLDSSGKMGALDKFTQRAVNVVTSGRVADALDQSKITQKERDAYGTNEENVFLLSKRLIEAGVRMVSFNWGSWDTHGDNFNHLRRQLPRLDQALTQLILDLHTSGLDKEVSIVMWGEFGRTPRINGSAGRDHWPRVNFAFLSGGGMRGGQAVGTTTDKAEDAKDRPVHIREVFATLYHNLGIDASKAQLIDPAGRPQYLVDSRKPIEELV